MIEVKHLDKFFDNGTRQVLHDISAKFYDGKVNLIIGQSGSGKTVLVKNLVGLFKPEHGEILYDGRDITKMNRNELKGIRKEIGMLFQGSALFDSETVMGNVIFPLMMFSDMTPEEQRERAQFCIDRVNLSGSENKYPAELSGGMQKRAAIARAIALNPKYLFCDEPNSGLDPKTSIVIDQLLWDITHEFGITTSSSSTKATSAGWAPKMKSTTKTTKTSTTSFTPPTSSATCANTAANTATPKPKWNTNALNKSGYTHTLRTVAYIFWHLLTRANPLSKRRNPAENAHGAMCFLGKYETRIAAHANAGCASSNEGR